MGDKNKFFQKFSLAPSALAYHQQSLKIFVRAVCALDIDYIYGHGLLLKTILGRIDLGSGISIKNQGIRN